MQKTLRKRVSHGAAVSGALLSSMVLSLGVATAQDAGDPAQLRMLGQCQGCSFENLNASDQRMTGIDLSEATIRDVAFAGSELNIAIFDFATLENVSFEAADLDGASFRGARLVNVSFENAELRATVFEDAVLVDTDLQAGRLCNTQMPNETMDNSDCD